ncbi:MAG: AMP-binding protein [Microthrixaceae bacterium]|nr:AMP-binding protein [Microthrixaceae bacterium]
MLRTPPVVLIQVADGSGHPVSDGLVDGALDYETALAGASAELPEDLAAGWSGDDLNLCYTGGTTGMPKGAMWRQEDFLIAALGVRRRDGNEYSSMQELVADARGTVRALPAPPLMHGAAHWNASVVLGGRGTVVIQDHPAHFDAVDVLDAAERHGATSLLVVGDPMARPLVDELERSPRSLPRLRHILSGGAVLSAETKGRLQSLLEDVTIVDVLGSTESGRQAVGTTRPGQVPGDRFVPADTSVVLSEDLDEVLAPQDHAVGWLAQSGRVPLGYLNDPLKSAATFPVIGSTRYAVPGDRARWGADGSIELLGRDSACINTGGEKVFAEEVETALKTHPAVWDAVVCGRPSDRWGSEVVAVVSLRRDRAAGGDPDDDELRSAAAAHLASYKLPKAIIRVEEVVRAPSGKADYRWARAMAECPPPPSPPLAN